MDVQEHRNSSELNTCDYFSWGLLKVYRNNSQTVEELKAEIRIVDSINRYTLFVVIENIGERLQRIMDAGGSHIQNVFS